MKKTATLKELAELFDLSDRRIQQLADEGIVAKTSRGTYRFEESVKGYIKFLQARADGDSLQEVKKRHLEMKAAREEHALRKLQGELVEIDAVVAAWGAILSTTKSRFRSLAQKVAPRARLMDSDGQAKAFIQKEVDKILNELASAEIEIKYQPPSEDGDEPEY